MGDHRSEGSETTKVGSNEQSLPRLAGNLILRLKELG